MYVSTSISTHSLATSPIIKFSALLIIPTQWLASLRQLVAGSSIDALHSDFWPANIAVILLVRVLFAYLGIIVSSTFSPSLHCQLTVTISSHQCELPIYSELAKAHSTGLRSVRRPANRRITSYKFAVKNSYTTIVRLYWWAVKCVTLNSSQSC